MAYKEKLVRKRSSKNKSELNREIFFFLIIAIFYFIFFISTYFLKGHNNEKFSITKTNTKKSNIIFVRQYSDNHITENAKGVDLRFKNLTFSDKKSLLGNVISALKKNDNLPQSAELENGSWLWTPVLQMTPEYIDKIIYGAKNNGIKNLYTSIDSYLDIYVMPEGKNKDELKKKFDDNLYLLISKAYENKITVDAEAGWRNWAEIGNSYKAFATLNYAIEFNKIHDKKFRGFQYDVEPYLLEYFQDDKKSVMGNFINLIDESVARLDGTDLRLSVVIPEFYDGTEELTPRMFYAGKVLFPIEQILRILDRREGSSIIVMSYRNFSRGENGSIDISKEEINTANNYNTKIIIGQETGDVLPPYITFFDTSKNNYDTQVKYLKNAFINDKSFGGIATHYVNSYLDLH